MRFGSHRLRAASRASVLALLVALGGPASLSAAGPPPQAVVKSFTLKYRKVEDALARLRPLLSDSGAVSAVLETDGNSLTVRGTSGRVDQIAREIAAFDVPLRAIDIVVTLLKSAGGKAHGGTADVSEDIRGVGERLKKLFNVTDFTRLDTVVVQGIEGQRVAYVMGGGYRLEFVVDPARDSAQVQLRELSLERVRHEAGKEVRGKIVRPMAINVNLGQPYILGIGRDESAGEKLFVVFTANWSRPGPGIFRN